MVWACNPTCYIRLNPAYRFNACCTLIGWNCMPWFVFLLSDEASWLIYIVLMLAMLWTPIFMLSQQYTIETHNEFVIKWCGVYKILCVLHIQVAAGDEPHMAGAEMSCMAGVEVSRMAGEGDVLYGRSGGVSYGWRWWCLVWPEMTVDSDMGWWHSAVLALSYILALWPS